MRTRITAAVVRQLTQEEPPDRETYVWDTVLTRLALRVRPPARPGAPVPAHYIIQWRVGRRTERMAIGAAAAHTPDEARAAARPVLRDIDAGRDPKAERDKLRDAWTLAEAAAAYFVGDEHAKHADKVQAGDRATIENHVLPLLGHKRLDKIEAGDASDLLRKVTKDTRVNARKRRLGGPGAAKKAVRKLSAVLTWAVNERRLAVNPIIGQIRIEGTDNKRDVVLESAADYARLLAVMDDMVARWEAERTLLATDPDARRRKFHPRAKADADATTLRPASRAFLTVALATGMRRGELQQLRWSNVDLDARRITLRSSKGIKLAKTGPKMETVSLPPLAVAALQSIRPDNAQPADQVFIPYRGAVYAINRDWERVRIAAGLPVGLVLHGLRHSAGTQAILGGMSISEVQKMLRHRNIATTEQYVHLAENLTGRLQDRGLAHVLPTCPAPSRPPAAPRLRVVK